MTQEVFIGSQRPGEGIPLEQYVTPIGGGYPMPSRMLFVAHPRYVPDEVLRRLLTPNSLGERLALLTDRAFTWRPSYADMD